MTWLTHFLPNVGITIRKSPPIVRLICLAMKLALQCTVVWNLRSVFDNSLKRLRESSVPENDKHV